MLNKFLSGLSRPSKLPLALQQVKAGRVLAQRGFSSQAVVTDYENKRVHKHELANPKFFEDDYVTTMIEEIDFVRSPLYDMAKITKLTTNKEMEEMFADALDRVSVADPLENLVYSPYPDRENVSFWRYADKSMAEGTDMYTLQQPRGEKLRRSVGSEIYRFHKPVNHWEAVRRSKSYIADDYFPPHLLQTSNLKELFEDQ